MKEIQTVNEEWQHQEFDYAPDGWQLVRITGTDPHYRVFGSWRGGYVSGDSWRLNSGIKSHKKFGQYYFFYGHSGSIYRCHEEGYGRLGSYNAGVLGDLANDTTQLINNMPDIENIDWNCSYLKRKENFA